MGGKPIQLSFAMSKSKAANLRAGALRVKESVREALKSAVDGSGLDRETIAKDLSRLVGEEVSLHTLNNWIADGKHDRRLPLEYAAALAIITGDAQVLNAALDRAGFKVLAPGDVPYYELGRATAEKKRNRKREREAWEGIEL